MNNYIDSTNLRPFATIDDITCLCEEARKYHFETVCVHPYYVELAKSLLKNTNVGVCTVVGFPLGMNTIDSKVYEAIEVIEKGADEIDMVINIGALKDKQYDYIKAEIEEVRDSIHGKTLKVIIETCYLTENEIITITKICNDTYVNYIKTSTGFGTRGASLEDIDIIKKHKNEALEIKASGNIRTLKQASEMIDKGATRIGTSNAKQIMEEKI